MRSVLFRLPVLFLLLRAGMPGPVGSGNASPPDAALPGESLFPAWAMPLRSSPPPPGVLEPALARALAEADPDDMIGVIVVLHRQPVPEQTVAFTADRAEARIRLVATLQRLAQETQAPLRAYLEGARAAGMVESWASFWIFNGLAVRARPLAIRALAAHPAVAAIRLDHYRRWLPTQQPPPTSPQQPATSIEWNISRIRADQVWSSLHISGTGAVVAGMDTGVDWIHPALQANYRGYNPHGSHNHTGNWFDAVNGSLYPVDDHGHGTHTLGTAVGQGGIGVAPGARWIGVKVLSGYGYGYDSWIHAGFQWLLAPGGDPNRAPDVVNCSWGSDNGALTTFQADLRALRAAEIFPVFANGNAGPQEGTVGSPASLPEAFAVGATDEYDQVANFSSRGPSPWGQVRPHVAAPGVHISSSLPGGLYGAWNGTSMAAPHVSGVAALLRSVSPTLSITRMTFLITSTAVPLGTPIPNNDSGWGRVNAFAAVAAVAHPGFITGTVTRAGDGLPIGGATVTASPLDGQSGGTTMTGSDGSYLLALAPAIYNVTASAFGYEPKTAWGVVVVTDTTSPLDFSLAPLPTGTLRGRITEAGTGNPLTATISIPGTPLETTADAYTFTLPAGTYTVRARRMGYRVVTATGIVTAGQVATADLNLPSAPSILLVDGGRWYNESQVGYFRQALDDLAYVYDEWPIRSLPGEVPTASDLAPYDLVVWSDPWGGPGDIGAQDAITEYLSAGGRLFLSGQDIGYVDNLLNNYPYYQDFLKVYLVQDSAETWTLEGVPGDLFSGLTLTITGAGGADNQEFPDVIGIRDPDAAAPILAYAGDGWGSVRVGTCLDYRAVYLSFGFEAINDRASRREVMGRGLDWLMADPPAAGLELMPAAQSRIGPFGGVVTHTVRVRHLGQAGALDTINLSLTGATWETRLSDAILPLAPCTSKTLVLTVTVPLTATWDARDGVTLTARSSLSPTLAQTAVITTKAPAPILLVDDDRFYEQREKYQAALAGAGLLHDDWQTCPPTGPCWGQSPPLEVLERYPIVVWWTGYDWFRPVTAAEEAALASYLEAGGRLFLSSQDYLYYHYDDPACKGEAPLCPYLGVLTYTEGITTTIAQGVAEDPIGAGAGPWELTFPFPYGPIGGPDGVKPTPGTAVIFRDQDRRGMALARRGEGYAMAFLAFPFEALPAEARPEGMERIVGWLSWLGSSTFAADRGAVSPADALTFTLRLHNDGPVSITASLSNTLPTALSFVPGSLTGPATYDPLLRRIGWEGLLAPAGYVTVIYQVTVAQGLPGGSIITNVANLRLEDHGIGFRRAAMVRVATPDLSPTTLETIPSPVRPGGEVSATLRLVNAGPGDALTATAVISLPFEAIPLSDTLRWEGGGAAEVLTDAIRWAGPLGAGGGVTVSCRLATPRSPLHPPLYSVAFVEDGMGGIWERPAWVLLEPWRFYLPVAFRSG